MRKTPLRQNAAAFVWDIGVSYTLFPSEDCPLSRTGCAGRASASPELADSRLEAVTVFTRASSVTGGRGVEFREVRRGKLLFRGARCTAS